MAAAVSHLSFDRYQFEKAPQLVETSFTEDGFQTTGISWDDVHNGMHMTKAGKPVQRRLQTPAWALNDELLREILLRFIEERALFRQPQTGTPAQRLLRAQARAAMHRAALIENITGLCHEYVAVKNDGRNPARLKELAIAIENIDTQLRFLVNAHKMALGVVYWYYRCGADSVETAAALNLKPPHVRMILWRLNKAAQKVLNPQPPLPALTPEQKKAKNAKRSASARARWARWERKAKA